MTGRVIDGVKLAATIREDVAVRAAALAKKGVKPGLAVI
ncbi:MAG: bifunctional methylenetetrahydrofolate dehydrogenase/methenyltetrahydrofolate cyclohydrolase, partial [Burkholderiales bacterium]|nr:bifunctional methylenetetrahydrofolate dehydrogenase/methenyltetrahydrofolate cyclohydrolase [Burkholderiales bacterium]